MSRLKSSRISKSGREMVISVDRPVGDGVGTALGAVEHRHLAEAGAGLQHRQGFFAGAGDVAADPDLALHDDVEPVARLPFLEHVLPALVLLLLADFRDARKFPLVEVGEDRGLPEELQIHSSVRGER